MIQKVAGDITKSQAQAIAHGVAPNDDFHQGLALALREHAPALYKDFRHYSQSTHPKPGTVWAWTGADGQYVISLFTQEGAEGHHGGKPGKASVSNVRHSLKALRKFIGWSKSKKKKLEDKDYDGGELLYKHIAGWNVFRIADFIATFARRAAARGTKGVLVIMDYYNNIPAHSQGNTADQLGQIALTLRNAIMRENAKVMRATDGAGGVHAIVFAQEAAQGDTPYGSTQILQYSQLHISIEREEATLDMPVIGTNGKQETDATGQPRFFHQTGDYSGRTKLRVLKANEDKRRTIEVMVENAMSRIYDVDRNGNPLIDAMF